MWISSINLESVKRSHIFICISVYHSYSMTREFDKNKKFQLFHEKADAYSEANQVHSRLHVNIICTDINTVTYYGCTVSIMYIAQRSRGAKYQGKTVSYSLRE